MTRLSKRALEKELTELESTTLGADEEAPPWVLFDGETDLELSTEEKEVLNEAFGVDVAPGFTTDRGPRYDLAPLNARSRSFRRKVGNRGRAHSV